VNRGDPQNGWDTDQFPSSVEEMTLAFWVILQSGGLGTGGCNFDAKLRRQSIDPEDLLHAHVGGVDVLARALLAAAKLVEDGRLAAALEERYAPWSSPLGRRILAGEESLASLAALVEKQGIAPRPRSGAQERLENLVARVTARLA
jgi:xylose isomerase